MASESALWKWLRELKLPSLDMERVENSAAGGTPDVDGQFGPIGFKIELKILHDKGEKNREETGRIKFEIGQREWGQNRWKIGGSSYVLVQGFSEDLYLIPGYFAPALPKVGVVKTSYLRRLSWWFCDQKSPEERLKMIAAIGKAQSAHHWVTEELQRDPQLHEACLLHDVHHLLTSA